MKDRYNLERFIEAQRKDYAIALSEIKNGRKETHWMWYIFPQVMGLGFTGISIEYSITDLDEAKAYLENEILGKRLIEISHVLLSLPTNNASEIFGNTDTMKLRSSMTLFSMVPGTDKVFDAVLDKFFHGRKDERTLQLLNL
ncbi:MAG: DUF1810 domain-containing protein [Bacteroidetes bacterium]|nr:DUF1810 domain-containing protein [Bacteroidota bacterium]